MTSAYANWFRDDCANRYLVDPPTSGLYCALGIHRLCNLGRISRGSLLRGSIPFSVLLTTSVWRSCARMVWPPARVVAVDHSILTCATDPVGTRWFQTYMLLLLRRIL